MRPQIEPYKRLYQQNKVTIEILKQKVRENKLTKEEFEYIISEGDN